LFEYVLPLRESARSFVKSEERIFCWNEDVMRGQMKFGLVSMIQMSWEKFLGMTDEELKLVFLHQKEIGPFWKWVMTMRPLKEEAIIKAETYSDFYGTDVWLNDWGGWLEERKEVKSDK